MKMKKYWHSVSYTHLDVYKRQIQEDLNLNIIKVEKETLGALIEEKKEKQYEHLINAKNIMRIEIWTCLLYTSRCV